jgi:hypothetical protein
LVSALALGARGRRFESSHSDNWRVVQSAERWTVNPYVAGSNPASPAIEGWCNGSTGDFESLSQGSSPCPSAMNRECGSCTKCCDGWLSGVVDKTPFYPGLACKFCITGTGCSNYENRPTDPCREFSCEWLVNQTIPDQYKPSACDVIVSRRMIGSSTYAEIIPAGESLDSSALSWFLIWALNNYGNVAWKDINGVVYHLGSKDFSDEMNRKSAGEYR